MARQYDLSIQKGHDALAIDPNNVWAHAYLGITLLQLGDTAEGVAQLQEANRLEEAPLLGAFLAYTGMLSAASVRKPSLC